jgi:hypothetical protein
LKRKKIKKQKETETNHKQFEMITTSGNKIKTLEKRTTKEKMREKRSNTTKS